MKNNVVTTQNYVYGGISGIDLAIDYFDFGESVELRRTYAHIFSSNMMAFARPSPKGYHPAPWKATKGGFGYDIIAELRAPEHTSLGEFFDAKETIWWIAALLRLAYFPHLTVPVISTHSFSVISTSDEEPTLTPLETEGRIFVPSKESNNVVNIEQLEWVKEKWISAGQLMNGNPKFYSAIKALDIATLRGRTSSSLLAMWGGLEQLFAPSTAELRFRVAALIASYLEPYGAARLNLYRMILKLYNERCVAAHTAQEIEIAPLMQTYVIMRNILVQMIDLNKVPTQDDLESLLFCGNNT
jgi:hypothetical protein